jgi:phosphatidate phosphatase APP1
LQVLPYLGYGSEKIFRIKGRVIQNKSISGALPGDNIWKNLSNMYKRFESDEAKGLKLKLTYSKQQFFTLTDEEGYFEVDFIPSEIITSSKWQEVEIEIESAPFSYTKGIKYILKILYPSYKTEFRVISDVDDTIVKTNTTSFLKMFTTTFLNNARSRTPFPGVSSLYSDLEKGIKSNFNLIFYVSSSPWNLYNLLLEFLITHNIPLVPLLLKDYGINESTFLSASHHAHKYFQIERILQTYPEMKFILIDDADQEDASIYSQIIKDFPERILAAYTRDLNIPKHRMKVLEITGKMKGDSVPMILVQDSLQAGKHALEKGFISLENLHLIEKEMNNRENIQLNL